MLLTIALVGLFALAAIATFSSLVDSAIRAVQVYSRLKLEAQVSFAGNARIRKIETIGVGTLAVCRTVRPAGLYPRNRTGQNDQATPVSVAA